LSTDWKEIDGLTLADDPLYYLGQVSQGTAFVIKAEDEVVALLIPPAQEHHDNS